ncbi:hypothetical protein NP233_g1803 [Leucocoprinus birnbaumii]|uniref:Uncharacterized protein n=1 Tax=Leucocoprinus birnbaumii TaxID=56174 RepID=A0AAD5W1G1_9AGAR|nr:hypothetical protein NP233_g1803 [Leucocoprinus birnbaumii]
MSTILAHQSSEKPPIATSDSEGRLRLDPGAPEREPRSAAKFCLWLTLTFLVVAGCSVVYFLAESAWYGMQHPHSNHYHKKPESEITDWSKVVRPLITRNDSFDVIASVWVRDDGGEDGGLIIDGEERPERLIFLEPIFRSVSLREKTRFTNVTLRVPKPPLRGTNISTYDLRASFVLVHSGTPRMFTDHSNFTTWKPSSLRSPSVRHWQENPLLEDRIYDSFGFTLPLIQFHNMPFENANISTLQDYLIPSSSSAKASMTLSPPPDSDDEDEDVEVTDQRVSRNDFGLYFLGDQKPAGDHHPYIVSRYDFQLSMTAEHQTDLLESTDLNIIDETNTYDRRSYTSAQRLLANKTCVNPKTKKPIEKPLWYQCRRSYNTNGVFETKIQTQAIDNDSNQNKRTQYMHYYAPHLTALLRSAGPKDLVPIPLVTNPATGGIAQKNGDVPSDEGFIEVNWRVSFSTRGEVSGRILDGFRHRHNMTVSGNDLERAQRSHETTFGMFGFRSSMDHHPRRVATITITQKILVYASWVWAILYWYTRASTVGLSRFGNTLTATSVTLAIIFDLIQTFFGEARLGLSDLLSTIKILVPLFMFKAIFRVEDGSKGSDNRRRGLYPHWHFAQPTHLERASERVEAQVTRRTKILFLLTLFAASWVINAQKYGWISKPQLLSPASPHPLNSLHKHMPRVIELMSNITLTFSLGGTVLQLVMNYHSKTYAGSYKINAYTLLFTRVLKTLLFSKALVGKSTSANGYSYIDVLGFGVSGVNAVQAYLYRSVRASAEVDESEE